MGRCLGIEVGEVFEAQEGVYTVIRIYELEGECRVVVEKATSLSSVTLYTMPANVVRKKLKERKRRWRTK